MVVINRLAGASIGDSIAGISDEDWYQSFDINVTAAMKLIRYAIPHFRAQGGASDQRGLAGRVGGCPKVQLCRVQGGPAGLTLSAARGVG